MKYFKFCPAVLFKNKENINSQYFSKATINTRWIHGKILNLIIVLLLTFMFAVNAFALTPTNDFYVNDYANILATDQAAQMLENSKQLQDKNGVQVVTVITESYTGDSFAEYSHEIFNSFGIGSKTDNTGVLLIVAASAGEVRIEVGTGMESIIPDSKAGNILDTVFMSKAQAGNLAEAIAETHMELIQVCSQSNTKTFNDNKPQAAAESVSGSQQQAAEHVNGNQSAGQNKTGGLKFNFGLILFILVILIMVSLTSRRAARRNYGGRSYQPRRSNMPTNFPRNTGHKNYGGGFGKSIGGGRFSGGSGRSSGGFTGGGGRSSGGGSGRSFGGSGGFGGGGGRSSGGGSGRKF